MDLNSDQLKEYNKLLEETSKLSSKIGEDFDSYEFPTQSAKITVAEFEKLKKIAQAVKEEYKEFTSDISSAVQGFKESVNEMKNFKSGVNEATSIYKKLGDIAFDIQKSQSGISKLSLKELETNKKKIDTQLLIAKNTKTTLERELDILGNTEKDIKQRERIELALKNINALLEDEDNNLKQTTETLEDNITQAKKFENALGLTGTAADGITESLNKLGLSSLSERLGISDAKDEAESYAEVLKSSGEDIGTINNQFKIAGNFVSNLGENLFSAFAPLDLAVMAIGFIVDAMVSADERAGKLAKNFGISYDAARGLSSELNDSANSSYLLNITTQGLAETFTEINNRYGTFAVISEANLETFSDLKDLAGLTSETIGTISDLSLLTGENAEDVTKEFLGQTAALNNQYGIALNEKQILEGISKTSAATLLTFNAQGKSLAEAIFKATALGMSLAEVENIASSLLDFESSISNELSAELITGRQLNLEKAREAALTNDLSTLTEEISKNIGSAAEFGKMNVIQQEALAKAVGMNREDLAKSLKTQEELEKLGTSMNEVQEKFNKALEEGKSIEEARAIAGDNSYSNMLASQTVGERFQVTMEKLKEAFVPLGEALLPVVDSFAEISKIVGPIVGFIGQIFKGLDYITGGSLPYLIAGFGTWKLLTSSIFKNMFSIFTTQGRINIAKKLGLITDQQATVAQKAANMMTKDSVRNSRAANFYKNKTLGATIRTNIQEGITTAKTKVSLGLENLRARAKARTEAAENRIGFAAVKTRIKQLGGFLVDVGKYALKAGMAVAGIPIIGPILAIAAIAAAAAGGMALYRKFSKAGDIMSPAKGKTQISTKEGGLFELSPNDDIIAAPGLLSDDNKRQNDDIIAAPGLLSDDNKQSVSSPTINIQPLVDKLMSIENVLTQILNKDSNISIDSTKLGTAMSISSAKIQ